MGNKQGIYNNKNFIYKIKTKTFQYILIKILFDVSTISMPYTPIDLPKTKQFIVHKAINLFKYDI